MKISALENRIDEMSEFTVITNFKFFFSIIVTGPNFCEFMLPKNGMRFINCLKFLGFDNITRH